MTTLFEKLTELMLLDTERYSPQKNVLLKRMAANIISCFPYPTTRPASPQCPPPKPQLPESCEHRAFCDAFGKLVQTWF
ncbi:hypothetical protein GCK72_000302 [Caenorhabditis remanei]|uniref:Uncharacterized protein n=1 Tax=Caenorhabditis remanei TaxID=31234 RepID=A0A6A5HJY3_CAERE|nr:hypothetical protein GCK72_000302 [Caenorhabditis remanei]KAF1768490.1 hypothetical protein GCK72_000302 [Caenorhabditis remanei]